MIRISKQGIRLLKVLLIGLFISFVFGHFLTFIALGLVLFLFRDEKRVVTNSNAFLSPCDGIIESIDKQVSLDIMDGSDKLWTKISIINGLSDIHVSRMPISGKIKLLSYRPGKSPGYLYKQKESLAIIIDGAIECVIVHSVNSIFHSVSCEIKKGDFLNIGETYANNTLGASVEIFIPSEIVICITEGQKMIASETLIAKRIV